MMKSDLEPVSELAGDGGPGRVNTTLQDSPWKSVIKSKMPKGPNKDYWLCYEPYIALQDMQTFENQAKIMLPFLVMLLLTKVSNCA